MKLRRLLKRTCIAVAVIIVLLVSLNLILTAIWSRQIDRELAKLRARGEPVTVADLVPKRVPDYENAAPLYDRAVAMLSKEDRSKIDYYFSGVYALQLSGGDLDANDDVQSEVASELRAIVVKQHNIFPLVEQAAARSRLVDLVKQMQGEYQYRDAAMGKLYLISKFIAVCAMLHSQDNQTQMAINDVLVGLSIAHPKDSGITTPKANADFVLFALRKITQDHSITDGQAELVYRELAKLDPEAEAVRQVRIERVFANRFYADARRDPFFTFCVDYCYRDEPEPSPSFYYRILGFFLRPVLCREQLYYLDVAEKEMAKVHKAFRAADRSEIKFPRYVLFSSAWLNSYSLRRRCDSQQAQIGLAQTTLALKVYKNRHGSYPASLRDLQTCPGWKLSNDPFSGKPFGYKRIGQGFRVWSIGDDLVDDGGRLDSEIHGPGTAFREDMVWIIER